MSYLIKYDDIRYVRGKAEEQFAKTNDAIGQLFKQIDMLTQLNSFRGASAENIKSYLTEVHSPLLYGIINLTQLFSSKLLLYCDGYYNIDSDKHATIPQEVPDFLLNDMQIRMKYIEDSSFNFTTKTFSINDIFNPGNPSTEPLMDSVIHIKTSLEFFQNDVYNYEQSNKKIVDIENLLNSLKASISEYTNKTGCRANTYQQGDFFKSETNYQLCKNIGVAQEYFNDKSIQGQLTAAQNRQAKVYEEIQKELIEQQKREQGIWTVIKGVSLVVVGGLCIFFSGGAAIPVVAGIAALTFGTADVIEGGQDIYYAQTGQTEKYGFNFIRDTVYMEMFDGDKEKAYKWYNISENIVAFSASAGIPIGMAAQTQTLTVRSVSTILAKELVGQGAGFATDWLGQQAGLNQTQRMMLGMISSFGTSKGLDMADAKFNVSGVKNVDVPKINGEDGVYSFKYNEVKSYTAEETNQWFIDNIKPDYKPPYKPETIVKEIELTENTKFVRVYDNMPDGSGMYGSWVMKAEDIKGLTPLEIQSKFALPNTPKYLCDVELKAGTHIRVGEVNPLEGWGLGGGIQYDLIGQRVGIFSNERLLEVN